MKKKLLYFIMLFTLPIIVFAEENNIGLSEAIFAELFCSIHMTIFVLIPLAHLIENDKTKVKSMVVKLFLIRVVILVILDCINPKLFFIDFFAIFLGILIVIPLMAKKGAIKNNSSNPYLKKEINQMNISADINVNDELIKREGSSFVDSSSFNPIYLKSDNELLDTIIKEELTKGGYNTKYIPYEMVKRRKKFNIIFVLLFFIYVVMIFFHFPLLTYLIGAVLLIVYYIYSKKFNILKYLNKEITSRPSDNMKNIIASVMSNCVEDKNNSILYVGVLFSIIISCIMFYKPVILYEKFDDGYYVRFYAWGISNYKTATIPEKHNGKYVIGLRGNTFSNMPYLESVELPNSIKVMRGQTFKNDKKLKSVNLPSSLEYLGGGAFYNCTSLTSIAIPDGVSEIGGEAFYNCTSLREVILPSKLSEIRGNTFENCSSLNSIEIPSTVVRIGGHAFYGCSSLSSVIIKGDSILNEIGSSAFRRCSSLKHISLPKNVSVNERAFKESPTNINYFDVNSTDGTKYSMQMDFYKYSEKEITINNYSEVVKIKLDNIDEIGDYKYNYNFSLEGAINDKISINNYDKTKVVINEHLTLEINYYSNYFVILDVYFD